MFFTKNETNIYLFIIPFLLCTMVFKAFLRNISYYNSLYPTLNIYKTLLIFSIFLAIIFVVLGLICRKFTRKFNFKKLESLLEKDEKVIKEADSNNFTKILPSILGLGVGFFIMPFILFPDSVQVELPIKIFIMLLIVWGVVTTFDYILRGLFFTDKRILAMFLFSKKTLSIYYNDIQSIFYDNSFLKIGILKLKTNNDFLELRNYKNMDTFNNLLIEKIDSKKG